MKTIVQRIEEVRAYVANELRDVPGSSSYIMQLDNIAHDVSLIETCPHGALPTMCRKCKAVAYRDLCETCRLRLSLQKGVVRSGASDPIPPCDLCGATESCEHYG